MQPDIDHRYYPTLITSDLHLTDNPRDEYRWGLFPWLAKKSQQTGAQNILVLGDITDAKDNHSAKLLNRVVNAFVELRQQTDALIIILSGNHDYMIPGHPFFGFLSLLPGITFVNEPTECGPWLFLPHTKSPLSEWEGIEFGRFDYTFIHQTLEGAVASNGMVMSGELKGVEMTKHTRWFSGDIHVPQKCGPVEYVGSPYHVHFGDRFEPRVVLLKEGGEVKNFRFPTIEKFVCTIGSAEELLSLGLKPGDQLKVRVKIPSSHFSVWEDIKRDVKARCYDLQIDLRGLEMIPASKKRIRLLEADREVFRRSFQEAVRRFCTRENLADEILTHGIEIAKEFE